MMLRYRDDYPVESLHLNQIIHGVLSEDWDRHCKEFPANVKGLATRQSSAECLNMIAVGIPSMVGGSADLAPSCLTTLKFEGAGDFLPASSGWGDFGGRNMHFGIREHAMGSVINGLALCKLRPFGSTFLVFSDYMKPSIRMSSIMNLPCTWVFTHDSIAVGEDGPTHQPVEHLPALRSIPGLFTFRPCDANETLEMWKYIATLQRQPVAVILSRQNLPTLDRSEYAPASELNKGAYVIAGHVDEDPDVILMASGSEVSLMLEAHTALEEDGLSVRSVSVPCMELFNQQSREYIRSVLPDRCRARVSVEAASEQSWSRYVGIDGEHVGVSTFGASMSGDEMLKHVGLTVEGVVVAARKTLSVQPQKSTHLEVIRRWSAKMGA